MNEPAQEDARPDLGGSSASPLADRLARFAPKLADLLRETYAGDIWNRPQLSRRDRSLITVSALTTAYRPDELFKHLRIARENGITQDEMAEVLTHLLIYAGAPSAVSAAVLAYDAYGIDGGGLEETLRAIWA